MDFESTLKGVGGFNRYQKLLLLLYNIIILVNTPPLYVQVFTAVKSDHWCKAWVNEECPDPNIDCEVLKKNLSIPHTYTDGGIVYEECVKYNVSGIHLSEAIELGENITYLEQIPCDEGWNFDRTTFPSTITIDFELVCERSHLPNIGQSAYFAGYLVGSLLGGIAADTFGRRPCLLVVLVMAFLVSGAIIFSPNFVFYISMRLCLGICLKFIGIVDFVMLMETASPSKRVFITNVHFMFFALGYFLLAGLAKLITGWRYLQLPMALPYIPLFIVSFIFVLESPRWLLAKGKKDEAHKILEKIAAINNRSVDINLAETDRQQTPESVGMLETIREIAVSPLLLFITINMCFNWFVQSLVFYGLSLSTSSLGIDPYLSFVVFGAIEIPAYFACMVVAEWLGRRGAVFTTMICAGLCCCGSKLIPLGLLRALVAMGGKFFITMSFSIVCTWAAELFPTAIRSTSMGLFSMSSRVGSILVPLVLLFEDAWTNLPYLIFGSFAILASFLSLLIPETKGKPLPTTVKDTKALYRKGNPIENEPVDENVDSKLL